jgi:hypothetical protein
MLNYTDAITALMRDIIRRVPALSFIDMAEVLVFARFGRSLAEGPYATCHSLNLPTSEPGYYFWKDRETGRLTRRSEWFVTKSPTVELHGRRISYLISFVLPRFCDQTLARSHKEERYGRGESWLAKLDTIVHELYHIDPGDGGIRSVCNAEGAASARSHNPEFFEQVADCVRAYLASGPHESTYGFLTHDFAALEARHQGLVATTFRQFPSYPQRYHEPLVDQPSGPETSVVPLAQRARQHHFTERDLTTRVFTGRGARRVREADRATTVPAARGERQ